MTDINPNVSLAYNLNHYEPNKPNGGDDDLYHVVVQKGNVGTSYVYALQLLHDGHNIYVFRGNRQTNVPFAKLDPVLRLIGQDGNTAGGHTQTWEYAGRSGDWLVGTKPKGSGDPWTTQITRVHIPDGTKIYKNTELPRLSHLNYAGGFHINMSRVEAAVSPSPNYSKLLIASADTNGNGYFSIYDMKEVNVALTRSQSNVSNGIIPDVDIRNLHCDKSFEIKEITKSNKVGSLQGYDIDDGANNIYISSQFAGNNERKIVKIPWNSDNPNEWQSIDLTYDHTIDVSGYYTEFEGIQLIGNNDVYLTVAYHDPKQSNDLTVMNRIYRVSW
ncbi:helveticin J family class III bacteriocin [Lactobacillus sp. PSON]|uniref:helveticin J family class III bacteriocin n=1 Tax=Lactobacillus sp. PSON TaxID=3455454 RepID=UPI004041CA36